MTPEELKIIVEYLQGGDELGMLANQPAALRKALSELNTFEEDQKLLQQQLRRAEGESDTPMPRGRTVRDGIYVRPDFSEMVSGAFRQIGGGLKENSLNSQLAAGLRGKAGTVDDYNAWKQQEAAKTIAARQAEAQQAVEGDHGIPPTPPVEQPTAPAVAPRRPMATSQRAPAPEVGGLSELTDMSPQRGRGYGQATPDPMDGMDPMLLDGIESRVARQLRERAAGKPNPMLLDEMDARLRRQGRGGF